MYLLSKTKILVNNTMQLMLYLLMMQFATDCMVQGSNTGGGEIFCPHPDWPWGPPSLLS